MRVPFVPLAVPPLLQLLLHLLLSPARASSISAHEEEAAAAATEQRPKMFVDYLNGPLKGRKDRTKERKTESRRRQTLICEQCRPCPRPAGRARGPGGKCVRVRLPATGKGGGGPSQQMSCKPVISSPNFLHSLYARVNRYRGGRLQSVEE